MSNIKDNTESLPKLYMKALGGFFTLWFFGVLGSGILAFFVGLGRHSWRASHALDTTISGYFWMYFNLVSWACGLAVLWFVLTVIFSFLSAVFKREKTAYEILQDQRIDEEWAKLRRGID